MNKLKYTPPVLCWLIKPEPVLSRLGCIYFRYRYGGYIDEEFLLKERIE
jgi:hypothetical protein